MVPQSAAHYRLLVLILNDLMNVNSYLALVNNPMPRQSQSVKPPRNSNRSKTQYVSQSSTTPWTPPPPKRCGTSPREPVREAILLGIMNNVSIIVSTLRGALLLYNCIQ